MGLALNFLSLVQVMVQLLASHDIKVCFILMHIAVEGFPQVLFKAEHYTFPFKYPDPRCNSCQYYFFFFFFPSLPAVSLFCYTTTPNPCPLLHLDICTKSSQGLYWSEFTEKPQRQLFLLHRSSFDLMAGGGMRWPLMSFSTQIIYNS